MSTVSNGEARKDSLRFELDERATAGRDTCEEALRPSALVMVGT